MSTTSITVRRPVRPALLAILSATLLAACGGGDAEELDAADASVAPAGHVEEAQAHAARTPLGGSRRAPICLDSPQACPPNVPPTH